MAPRALAFGPDGHLYATTPNGVYRYDGETGTFIDEFTKVAGTDLVRQYRGNYPSNWAYQVDGVVQALNRKSEFLLLRSPRVQRASTARGSMGGLLWQITQATGATSGTYPAYDTTSETFSLPVSRRISATARSTSGQISRLA